MVHTKETAYITRPILLNVGQQAKGCKDFCICIIHLREPKKLQHNKKKHHKQKPKHPSPTKLQHNKKTQKYSNALTCWENRMILYNVILFSRKRQIHWMSEKDGYLLKSRNGRDCQRNSFSRNEEFPRATYTVQVSFVMLSLCLPWPVRAS